MAEDAGDGDQDAGDGDVPREVEKPLDGIEPGEKEHVDPEPFVEREIN